MTPTRLAVGIPTFGAEPEVISAHGLDKVFCL